MKQKIISFIIAIVCVHFEMQSQNFIDETKQWAIVAHSVPDTPYHYSTFFYKFYGDSILNGKTYHKLYESNDSNQVNWSLHFPFLWYERNDSVFQYYSSTIDTLVYDFNIQEGDSFNLGNQDYMKVDSIRYLEWGGSLRKHWFFCKTNSDCSEWYRTIWIEGIGQLGLFTRSSEIGIYGAYVQLLCFYENGNLVYQNPNYNSCYVATSSKLTEDNSKKGINVFQSENGRIIIDNPDSEKGVIVFYTIDGRQINELKIESDNTRLDLKYSGMIIYKFTNLNGKTQTGKILIILP